MDTFEGVGLVSEAAAEHAVVDADGVERVVGEDDLPVGGGGGEGLFEAVDVADQRLVGPWMRAAHMALAAIGVERKEVDGKGGGLPGDDVRKGVVLRRKLPQAGGVLCVRGEVNLGLEIAHVVVISEDDFPWHTEALVGKEDVLPCFLELPVVDR